MFFFFTKDDATPSAENVYDVKVKMGHNDPDPNKEIPAAVFFQGQPVKLVELKGKMEETFTGIRVDPANQKILGRIELAGNSSIGAQTEVALSQPAPDLSGYELHWTAHRINSGHYRVHLIVMNGQRESREADMLLVPSESVAFVEQGHPAVNFRTGQTITATIPAGGNSYDVVFDASKISFDLYLPDLKKTYQINLHGPQAVAPPAQPGDGILAHLIAGWEGREPWHRLAWAWLPVLLFLVLWFGGIIMPILITGILTVLVAWFIRGSEENAALGNQSFGSVMRTNNHWWYTWASTTLAAAGLSLMLAFFGPSAPDPLPDTETTAATNSDEAQRQANLNKYGMARTDAEMQKFRDAGIIKDEPATESETETPGAFAHATNFVERRTLPDQSFWSWVFRLFALALLVLITTVYAIFAFSDEIGRWIETRREETGGDSVIVRIIRVITGAAKNAPKGPGTKTGRPTGLWRWILYILMADEGWEILRAIRKHFLGK